MKAIIEFNLPEDQDDYELFNKASKMNSVLWDFKQHLRNILKHNPDGLKKEQYDIVEKIQKDFLNLLDENNINFD